MDTFRWLKVELVVMEGFLDRQRWLGTVMVWWRLLPSFLILIYISGVWVVELLVVLVDVGVVIPLGIQTQTLVVVILLFQVWIVGTFG